MKVLKFGGTSVGTASRIKKVAGLAAGAGRNLVVLSAMSGTTNTLEEIAGYLYNRNADGAKDTIARLESKYLRTISELYSTEESRRQCTEYVQAIFEGLTALTRELFGPVQEKMVLAQGELLSSRMMELYLREQGVDVLLLPALDFMKLDAQGEPDQDYIRSHLLPMLDAKADLYLTQGYICRNAHDEVDNLQRGGSDYTASLAGAAIGAEEIQIWTDIDGMHDNDPRVVDNTRAVRHLHFDEAAELAYFGAKILHPTCIQPAKYANIPVRLLSTMAPSAPGTLIDNTPDSGTIKAVAAKDNIAVIKIKSSRMLLAHGFLRKVFEIFESYRTSIDMICTSEVGVSMSIDDTRYLNEIVHHLKKYGTVSVDLDMCLICVVGDMDWENVGFESRVMDAMKEIPVRMVGYGGSNYNISFLVKEEDKKRALQALSAQLFA
ncbi:MAG: aspartate kinase [Bacteroidales bacterium]|nr:aspartate kinase [Bacteroidales bacterium]